MSAVPIVTKAGPRSYVPAVGTVVQVGQVVAGTTGGTQMVGGRIVIAAAASTKVVGVAVNDAMAPEDLSSTPGTDALGRPVVSMVPIPTKTAVIYGGMETLVTYAADAAFGDPLIAAANGSVTPAGATPDARTIIGKCTEPGGVVVATNPIALARITV